MEASLGGGRDVCAGKFIGYCNRRVRRRLTPEVWTIAPDVPPAQEVPAGREPFESRIFG